MTAAQAGHLSEEALSDVLIGMGSPEAEAHMTGCSLCRSQVEQFRADMQLFDATSLAWSKAKSVNKVRIFPPWNVRQAMLAPVGWAMAAAVVVMIAVPSWLHERPAQRGPVAVAGSEYGDSDAQIAQDNALLRSVDVALADGDSTLRQFGIADQAAGSRKATYQP